ncbi:MAG: hypothetical protein KatS3mg016_1432 [Fimbriimonadales bacterium]|nr:MAG: hypothetical protein KatS3mg016_1432 [Fimbriimonadales bacterium]
MRILLTGCAGFIGAKTAELLLEQGHTVIGIDNLNDAYDPKRKQWRLSQLQVKPCFYEVDITAWQAAFQSIISLISSRFIPCFTGAGRFLWLCTGHSSYPVWHG